MPSLGMRQKKKSHNLSAADPPGKVFNNSAFDGVYLLRIFSNQEYVVENLRLHNKLLMCIFR